jgi:hypothetical protein
VRRRVAAILAAAHPEIKRDCLETKMVAGVDGSFRDYRVQLA